MKNLNTLKIWAFSLFMGMSPLLGMAQLPSNFRTKINYHEEKKVSYSMVNEDSVRCLTLGELARYHGYYQFYKMDEYIDNQGYYLVDKQFVEERDVRDEWMEDFSRITVGVDSVYVYAENGSLFYTKPTTEDPSELISEEESENFGLQKFDNDFFIDFKGELQEQGFKISESNGIILATSRIYTITFDKNTMIAGAVEFDSNGFKIRESMTNYEPYSIEEKVYFAQNETELEWFWSKKGCCLRKSTEIKRMEYNRTQVAGVSGPQNDENNLIAEPSSYDDYEIRVEQNEPAFRVITRKGTIKPLDIVVYDLNGKKILETKVKVGERVELPTQARAGMYIVHLKYLNRHLPITGKIIKPYSGAQF